MTLLERIRNPRDLDALDMQQMHALSAEIREFLVRNVSVTGGHLGPNLGIVETTLAIHRVFDSPNDSIIFDTGHQSYVHKLVTGRQDFGTLRLRGGLAGYPQRSESVHDIVESSHASASLSWADGIAKGYRLTEQNDRYVVAVIGDGALTGGMSWEALNNISDDNERKLVIVVNDNGRSYAPTIGGLARYLNGVRTDKNYRRLYKASKKFFYRFGLPGRLVYAAARGAGKGVFGTFAPKGLFPNLDIKYIGPIDGHDQDAMEQALTQAKNYSNPVIVHAITKKGFGFSPAMDDEQDQFHAVGKINPETGEALEVSGSTSWTEIFGRELVAKAREREDIIGITGAMLYPVGLNYLADEFPKRVFDVGIAEQHAVTSAAGMAFTGLHPVVAIYATFMNRAFDQVLMDVALHKAGVTFVLDRAGVTGPDGPSHHGIWDLSLLQLVPGVRIAAPRDAETLKEELAEALLVADAPTVLRFPKGNVSATINSVRRMVDGVDVLFESNKKDVLLLAVGSMAKIALDVAQLLESKGVGVTVIDPRWVIPVAKSVVELAASHRLVVTIEDGLRVGGIGTRVRQEMRAAQVDTGLNEIGIPDEFIDHATRDQILHDAGLTPERIAEDILAQMGGERVPHAKPEN